MVNNHMSVILDIDFDIIARLDDLVDHLAVWSDNLTNLFRIDIELLDLRSIGSDIFSRFADCRHHIFQNLRAGNLRLCQSFFKYFLCDSCHLDIHLQCCDTLACTGNLKVHVTEVILHTLNIRQYGVLSVFLIHDQTHGNTSHRRLDRYTSRHQRHGSGTDGCLGGRTVGFGYLGYRTNRVREILNTWQYLGQCTLTQCTMTDLTTARASHTSCFSYGIRREVIVMHEALRLHLC